MTHDGKIAYDETLQELIIKVFPDSFTELCNRIVAAVAEPKLNSEELIEAHKCANAAAVVKKIFTPEEIQRLNFEINSLGWQVPVSEVAEETKNS
ncbi:MAG: hypothetical protein LIO87_10655 [Eubacterium sp.]|nr:hypothetical protein [Eubacterium sp.]